MKFSQSETSFDLSICNKRVTRSSVGSVHNTKLLKKLPRNNTKNKNSISKKEKKVNSLTKSPSKREANVISLDDIVPPKRTTRSSIGNVALSSSKKLPKSISKLETKNSKQLKNKPNQVQPKSNSRKVEKPNVKVTSLPLAEIDDISSLAQSDVKGKKSSKPVLKKKADEILSRKQSSRNLKKNQSNDKAENSSVTLIQTRVTRSSLGNVNSRSTQEVNPKNKSASPVVKVAEKQQKVKKTQASKEEQSLRNEYSKQKTRSSSSRSSIQSRNKSTRSRTKPKPNPGKQIKTKVSPEKEKLVSESSFAESSVVCSVSTRSAKKAVPKNPLSIQRVSRSQNLSNTSVLSPAANTSLSEGNMLKPTTAKNARLSASILPISAASISGTRRTASSKSKTSSALETKEKNSPKSKKPRGVKRKSDSPLAMATKRKRNTPTTTHTSAQDLEPSQSTSTDKNIKKHTRRHTVDALLKTKGPKIASNTQQKEKKASDTKGKSAGQTTAKNSSSRSTPDISILPLDAISTFTNNRPKSAPAALKKQSVSKGLAGIPRKGTLKRKRWLSEALKEKNHSYEDDIFENRKFATPFRLPNEADEESDTSIATPKFGFFLTPAVAKRTPKFKDIISPSNLVKARKNAEEYLYRRQNRNKAHKVITLKTPALPQRKAPSKLGHIPEKKKLEFAEAMDKIQTIKSTIEAKAAEESDEEEDNYLSDLST